MFIENSIDNLDVFSFITQHSFHVICFFMLAFGDLKGWWDELFAWCVGYLT